LAQNMTTVSLGEETFMPSLQRISFMTLLVSMSIGLGAGALEIHAQTAAGQRLAKKRLPPTINSVARELAPMISADGRTLYFTREVKDVEHQTIWHAERKPDGSWGAAIKMPPPLNNNMTTFLSAALPDNNTLLVGGTFGQDAANRHASDWLSGNAGGGPSSTTATRKSPSVEEATRVVRQLDEAQKEAQRRGQPLTAEEIQRIFAGAGGAQPQAKPPAQATPRAPADDGSNRTIALTHRTASGWSTPEYLRIKGFFNVAQRNDFFLAPGNKVLILSIQTYETVGKRDLYMSFQQPGGAWSEPRNMGRALNSTENEISPFIAADGKSLYFASDRGGGLGGFDIYLARRADDTWLNWSPPKSLGPEINSALDEANLTVDASGAFAFMSQGETYKEDLYEFALPIEARPVPVAFVRGMCKNPAGKPVAASVAYERLRDGVGAGVANAHPSTGRYQIALAIGEDYAFRAEAANHIPVSERLDLKQAKQAQVVERDLVLVPIAVGASIRLNNIFFETAKAALLPESKAELDRLTSLLKSRPTMAILIGGHTDSEGVDDANQRLSEARAAAVRSFLIEHGVTAARLQSQGFGETRPVASNDSPEGRQLNRRVEFTIVKE
jgi:outer membrane protein OmpA-like peptidoglycan-associated protein